MKRTILNIGDDLHAQAVDLTGVQKKTALMCEVLNEKIESKTALLLALLGGSVPWEGLFPRRHSAVTE